MLENLGTKVKNLTVKYLKAYKVRVGDYIRVEKGGSSSDSDEVMFSADHHGNVNVSNTLTTNSLVTRSLCTISEQFYAPVFYSPTTVGPVNTQILTSNDVLNVKHIVVNVVENTSLNLQLPTAVDLLNKAIFLLGRKPIVASSLQKGDWFIFTVTNNSLPCYNGDQVATLVLPPSNTNPTFGVVTITGGDQATDDNGLGSLCAGAAHFGLYFTNVNTGGVAVNVLRLSGDAEAN
jgi:hypothetical protein